MNCLYSVILLVCCFNIQIKCAQLEQEQALIGGQDHPLYGYTAQTDKQSTKKKTKTPQKPRHNEMLTQWFAAAQSGNLEIIEQYVDRVDINAQDEGWSALIYASYHGYENIVKRLLEVPAINVNLKNNIGNTALICAASTDHKAIVEQLLKNKSIDVNLRNKNGYTALLEATYNRHEDIAELLLKIPDLNLDYVTRHDHDNVVMIAAYQGCENILKVLLRKPIKINAQNKHGQTALIQAISDSDRENIIKILLATSGIDINIKDKDGKTVYMYAIERRYRNIAKLIEIKLAELDSTPAVMQNNRAKKVCGSCGKEKCNDCCGRCKLVYYCSVACQKNHWNIHKINCKKA